MKKKSLPNYISRTGSTFETEERFLKNTAVVDSTQPKLDYVGAPLTQVRDNLYATAREEMHTFIIGETGCGKTRRVIMPMIRLMAKTGQSMVIADPKGELYRNTANALRDKGYKVMVLNFRNPSRGSRWNPLGIVETMYRSGDQETKDRAMLLFKDIVDIMKQEVESAKDRFWENQASKVLIGVAQILLEYGEPNSLTFENISTTAKSIFDSMSKKESFPLSEPPIKKLLEALPDSSPIRENLHGFVASPKDTRNSIVVVFESIVSVYTNQSSLLDLFSVSEIDVADLGKRPTALYFILPDDSGALYPIATVFVKQIYSTLINNADNNPSGKLDNKVSFLLDEFANFAEIPSVDAMLTAARSRGMTFVLVCQSMEQLIKKYREGAEVLLANCRIWVYMSCRNLPFLNRLQNLAGMYVSPYTGARYPLVSIEELQHFDMGEVLILNDRCRPMMGYLPDYSDYAFGEGPLELAALPDRSDAPVKVGFDLERAIDKLNEAKPDGIRDSSL